MTDFETPYLRSDSAISDTVDAEASIPIPSRKESHQNPKLHHVTFTLGKETIYQS